LSSTCRSTQSKEHHMKTKLEVKKQVVKELTAEELQALVGACCPCEDSD
jgi:hypothetical protein